MGWIWGSSPKENRFTHFGFSQDWKNVKLCTSTMCTVGSSLPSHPSLPVSLSTSLPRQGTSAAAEEELGGVRELLSTLGMRGRGCAVAFSYQVFVLACFGPVCSYTYHFFAGCWLWTPHCLSTSILLTNGSVQSRPPHIPSLFLFLLDLNHDWGCNQGLWQTSSKQPVSVLSLRSVVSYSVAGLFCANSALEHITYMFLLSG